MLATMLHRNNIVWFPALLAVHKHMQTNVCEWYNRS
jgi:hypothetical protein